MGEDTLSGLARPHLNDFGQNSGWAVSVLDGDGTVLDIVVVHAKEIGPDGEEAAIRHRLSSEYDLSDAELTRTSELTGDGLRAGVIRISGLRSA
ncbi:hypothetical protein [Agromyces sp. SYSU T00194]|uniref:hypothetical protein n=1 Tax=Agromyces chitinivorans TaxID=3158560 RepID=UPI00339A0ED2